MRFKKFASEIFGVHLCVSMLQCEIIHGFVQELEVKTTWDQAFRGCLRRGD